MFTRDPVLFRAWLLPGPPKGNQSAVAPSDSRWSDHTRISNHWPFGDLLKRGPDVSKEDLEYAVDLQYLKEEKRRKRYEIMIQETRDRFEECMEQAIRRNNGPDGTEWPTPHGPRMKTLSDLYDTLVEMWVRLLHGIRLNELEAVDAERFKNHVKDLLALYGKNGSTYLWQILTIQGHDPPGMKAAVDYGHLSRGRLGAPMSTRSVRGLKSAYDAYVLSGVEASILKLQPVPEQECNRIPAQQRPRPARPHHSTPDSRLNEKLFPEFYSTPAAVYKIHAEKMVEERHGAYAGQINDELFGRLQEYLKDPYSKLHTVKDDIDYIYNNFDSRAPMQQYEVPQEHFDNLLLGGFTPLSIKDSGSSTSLPKYFPSASHGQEKYWAWYFGSVRRALTRQGTSYESHGGIRRLPYLTPPTGPNNSPHDDEVLPPRSTYFTQQHPGDIYPASHKTTREVKMADAGYSLPYMRGLTIDHSGDACKNWTPNICVHVTGRIRMDQT